MKKLERKLFISTHNPIINGGVYQMMKFVGEEMFDYGLKPSFIYPSHSIKDLFSFKIEDDVIIKFPARKYFSFPFIEFVKFLLPSLYMRFRKEKGIYQGLGGSALTGLPFFFNSDKYIIWIATTFKSEFRTQLKVFKHFQPYYLMNLFLYPFNRYFEKLVIKKAAKIIALSKFTRDNIVKEFKVRPRNIAVINIPVDSDYFSFSQRKLPNNRAIRLLTVGRLDDPRKNITLLVKAFKELLNQGFNLRLMLAGVCKPKKLFSLKSQIKDIRDKVDLHISTSLEKIKELYRTSDIFILTSNQEGLGIVILEAMSSGLPVIATRSGGPEEIISDGDNGMLFNCEDLEQLMKSIVKLLSSEKLYSKFSKSGRETIETKFSKVFLRDKMIKIYKEIFPEVFIGSE